MKNLILRITIISLFFGIFNITNINDAQSQDDWEYWSEYSVSKKITDNTKLKFMPTVKYRNDMKSLYQYEGYFGVAHKLSDHVDLGLYYYYGEETNSKDEFAPENRLRSEATYKWKMGEFKWSNRFRFEWRKFDDKPKSRYRNRIKIAKPVKLFGQDVEPFVSDEIFYDFRADEFNQNRLALGISKKFTKHVKGTLFYMLKSKRTGTDWNEAQVLGSSIDISL